MNRVHRRLTAYQEMILIDDPRILQNLKNLLKELRAERQDLPEDLVKLLEPYFKPENLHPSNPSPYIPRLEADD